MEAFILILFWYLFGVVSFVFWWTYSFDLRRKHIKLALVSGILGPFNLIIGQLIHGDEPGMANRFRHLVPAEDGTIIKCWYNPKKTKVNKNDENTLDR